MFFEILDADVVCKSVGPIQLHEVFQFTFPVDLQGTFFFNTLAQKKRWTTVFPLAICKHNVFVVKKKQKAKSQENKQ